ncbi:MAG: hypothetical protein WBK20_07480 [Spirochaetota bacterium]
MKYQSKIMIVYVAVSLMVTVYGGCKKDNNQTKEIENTQSINIEGIEELPAIEVASWKYGFALDKDGNPIYHDPHKDEPDFQISYFIKSDEEVKKIDGDIIKADAIQIHYDEIHIMDCKKDSRGNVENNYRIKFIIKNNRDYISKDGKNWEVLEIKYLKETKEKNLFGEPLILVYFKCSFFEGEYYITSHM